ncbi:MAG: hypothetical protein M3449_02975 [Acidobacteriota bacterium]|nr:hypothetical protein [Acidobacteriota bacterium]
MNGLTTMEARTTDGRGIFQRFALQDETAVKDCIDAYGNFIWALAKRLTDSTEEAEAATQEIFYDIWRYADYTEGAEFDEKAVISQIARRRLIEYAR